MPKKITKEIFIERSREVHGNKYDYSRVIYTKAREKVIIICPIHGEFQQTPNKHYLGGCKECGFECISNSKTGSFDDFIVEAKEVHSDLYEYGDVGYNNKKSIITIICPIHGEFHQMAKLHLRGYGCQECGLIKSKNPQLTTITSDIFITKAKEVHGDKYGYDLVDYIGSKDKVIITCGDHGEFLQRPNNHLNGQCCPICMTKTSHQEIELREWLSGYIDIETSNRMIIPPLELDIVIPDKKIAIEYNGIYWHSERRGKDRHYHLNKYNRCKDAGYRLIQVWENEWTLKKDIVKSIILSAIGIYDRKLHGRNCGVTEVSPQDAREFYEENHIQGFKGGKHQGLRHRGELVSLLTINKINILERFATKKNVKVHGAFSKLLKSFGDIDGLITFADLRYFTGGVYEMYGFDYQYISKPNYFYFYFNNTSVELHSRLMFQKHKLKKKLDVFDPEITEYQNMLANGYDRIWDCGNIKYIYNG